MAHPSIAPCTGAPYHPAKKEEIKTPTSLAFPVTSDLHERQPRTCCPEACLRPPQQRPSTVTHQGFKRATSLAAFLFLTLFCAATARPATPALPESSEVLSLVRLGYPSDVRLQGSDPSFT